MSHKEQQDFVSGLKVKHPEWFTGKAVLEFGSYNINGTVRDCFTDIEDYVGVDWRAGPCVDEVALFHEFRSDRMFDILVSVNTFEHDPYWRDSLATGVGYINRGGAVLVVCGAHGMVEHEHAASPTNGYYRNLEVEELQDRLSELGVTGQVRLNIGVPNRDLFFFGIKETNGARV